MQRVLAETVPYGLRNDPVTLQHRRKIIAQQQELAVLHDSPLSKSSQIKTKQTGDQFLKTIMTRLGIKRYGVTQLTPEMCFENSQIPRNEKYAIVFPVKMNYHELENAPSIDAGREVMRTYSITGKFVLEITRALREHGIQTTGHHPLGDLQQYHHVLMPIIAYHAGLGEQARTGLFIDHEYGPQVRLGVVTTALPLTVNDPVIKGITEFCKRCQLCAISCPVKAITTQKFLLTIKNNETFSFKVNGKRCIKYFEANYGCSKCIVNCVFVTPNHEKFQRIMNRTEQWYKKWVLSGRSEELLRQEGILA